MGIFNFKKKISFWGCLFFLFILYFKNISDLVMPAICMDEIGYWANAAFWNGWNWSSVMSNFAPYYSYGYSVILFLLMKLFKDPFILHQAAIMMNIVMIVCGYCIMTWIVKRFFFQVDETIRNIICLIPFFYPSIQHHTQVAWTETYLFLLFLISIVLLIRVLEKGKTIYYFLFALVLMDMYITHQRSIAIVIIGSGLLFVVTVLKRDRWKQIGIFAIVIILCVVGSSLIKKSIYENVYTNIAMEDEPDVEHELADINDFQGQVGKLQYIFSKEGVGNLLISFFGKVYYFIVASFMMGGLGLWYLVYGIIKYIRNRSYDNLEGLVFCYILGAYLGTTLIAAIFMIYPSRLDTVAYGRYTDWIGIIIITFGLFNLLLSGTKEKAKMILPQVIFCLFFLLVFENYVEKYNVSSFFPTCSPIFSYFSYQVADTKTLLMYMTKTMITGGVIIGIIALVKHSFLKIMLVTVFLIHFWTNVTALAIDDIISLQHEKEVCPIVEYVQEVPDKQIYYLYDDTSCNMSNLWTGSIQYFLLDRSLYCIKDMNRIKEDSIIIICENVSVPQGYVVECETAFYKVIRKDF